ncbi:hypothetical protein PSEUBRA_002183 [Kalmanozyma brasiliensis GHG001]|uniref:Zn(2)-C6 fungal-type domain-containing protein n=1 Tax=Kalmanozyma brasiliensis (strain GHG001) TaxID=1365824 RepID=V5GQ92_KALBG|nr:uncharacterized protein PSEUBRA_002183 [Kalmanozyma brasiliensis GHG001]EST08102.1 hypothetical protein PSEUBRA_002183 [Kalmanozyma brasiliensis GHG001]
MVSVLQQEPEQQPQQQQHSHHNDDDDSVDDSDNEATASTSQHPLHPSADKPDKVTTEKKVSCQPCREAKVKCIPSPDPSSSDCTRCLKLDRPCFYRTHKRGRKPGKIKFQQILRRLELLDRTLTELRELNDEVGDPDAGNLIETLMWQLRRSKFFDKSNAITTDLRQDQGAKEVKREREASTPSVLNAGDGSSGRGTPIPPVVPMSVHKGRSDFNMLVDLEDHASVARVPDEFPTLSNPLKLLAQASSEESERRGLIAKHHRSEGSSRSSGLRMQVSLEEGNGDKDDEDGHAKVASGSSSQAQNEEASDQLRSDTARKRRRSKSPASNADASSSRPPQQTVSRGNTTATSWASTYFSRGAFHPVYDNTPEHDPIDLHLLSLAQATRLVSTFYASFGTFMHIFDPDLSTITYIRKHSAFLLTVICALSAEFESSPDPAVQTDSASLALTLRKHYEGMITWLTASDYKNVEMAQAFFLLASYRPMSDSAMSDQTWLFLGTAIRIATELGCNLTCYSYSTSSSSLPPGAARDHYQRQLRNTERLWINLWNLEKTLASQTGQRMHLADEGVVAHCSRWHRMDCALRQDEVLVAQVELRRVMIDKSDHFNTHVLRSLGARRRLGDNISDTTHQAEGDDAQDVLSTAERDQLSLQLSYFRNAVSMDLKRWEERWLSSSMASSTPTPLQITGPLWLDYAALVTYALPLPISYNVDVTPELTHLYRHCYISCTNYMATFIDRSQRGLMDHITNSTIVSTVYAVVFALDLARKAIRQRDGPNSGVDFGFVSAKRVVNLARMTAKELDAIGASKSGRRGRSIASKYSVFLRGVLARFEPEDDGEEVEGETERAAVGRGFSAQNPKSDPTINAHPTSSATDTMDGQDRHLRRDHNHPLPHRPHGGPGSSVPHANLATATGKQGTRASHFYSSNLMFSPQPSHPAAPHGSLPTSGGLGGWSAPAPSPANPHHPSSESVGRFVPPHHHHPAEPSQNWQSAAGPAALNSPATWFAHQLPGALEDPSWEWMMKDLDFFSVDGGGGGGEPILDQMGRLFG